MTYSLIKQGSEEWHAERAKRLTASDFGAALGVNPYCSRQKLWRIKVGLETVGDNIHITRGRDNEQQAIFEYSVETGHWVDEVGLVVHPAHDWLGASCDGLVGDSGLVEVKCPVQIRAGPPAYHMAQVLGQLEVTARDWCDYWQWTREGTSCIRIARDPAWWARALPVLERFWGYVIKLEQPPKGSCRMRALAKSSLLEEIL